MQLECIGVTSVHHSFYLVPHWSAGAALCHWLTHLIPSDHSTTDGGPVFDTLLAA